MFTETTATTGSEVLIRNLLSFSDLCSITRVRVKDLRRYCDSGSGPRAVTIAGYVRYRPEDVLQWLEVLAQASAAEKA